MKTYTTSERTKVIYNTVVDVFNWNKSSDRITPLDFVRKQFEDVPVQGTICIPGAGIGTYVLVALEKGFLPENITAVEIDPMYYELGSGMFKLPFGVNYVHTDFLTWEPNMKFDVVIGNPPYQSPKNVNGAKSPQPLWRKFLVKSSDLIEDGGYIYLLVPSSVAKFHCEGKVSPALQKVPDLSVLSIDTSLESFFKVGTEISLISFTKGNQEEFIRLNDKPWNWKKMPWVPRVSDENSVALLQKLFSIKGRLKFVPQYHWKPLDINTNTSIGTWGMNRGKDYGIQSLQGFENLDRKVHLMCCEFPSQKQREKAILLFKSPVYRFLKAMLMFGSDVAFSTLSSLPVPDGWKSINSIEEATSSFKLTSKELQIIEKY